MFKAISVIIQIAVCVIASVNVMKYAEDHFICTNIKTNEYLE